MDEKEGRKKEKRMGSNRMGCVIMYMILYNGGKGDCVDCLVVRGSAGGSGGGSCIGNGSGGGNGLVVRL